MAYYNTIENVDYNSSLILQCAVNGEENSLYKDLTEDEIRKVRGTIISKDTQKIVCNGGVFPYEFTENEKDEFIEKMAELNHKLEDMDIDYSYECTIIRVFYYNKWYISTHRKLDSDRSKWGSNNSFKYLFEKGLKESYNLDLKDLLNSLNLRCQYTFMLMADENTRFVCNVKSGKNVYFIGSDDHDFNLNIERCDKPLLSLNADCIFKAVSELKYPFDYQGILLTHKSGSQYRIINSEYLRLFNVRNNEQSVPFRYLQLKAQNQPEMIKDLEMLYPKYIPTFEEYNKNVIKLSGIVYHHYLKRKNGSVMEQIDQRIYLFIKNKLLKLTSVTETTVLDLLWKEEPSNLNHMIKFVKRMEKSITFQLNKLDLNGCLTPSDQPIIKQQANAPKKRVKYTNVMMEFSTCRRKLCF
jgi:hypothetical protein